MKPTTLYTLATAPELALVHAGVLEAMEHFGEDARFLAGVPIRFFYPGRLGLYEIDSGEFLGAIENGFPFTYERHTVRENGVSQIVLVIQEG